MADLRFKIPNGQVFTTTREQIMIKATKSLFATIIDPEQKMQVKDADGCFTLTYETEFYQDIFDYLNGLNDDNKILKYDAKSSIDDKTLIVRACEYFMLPGPPTGWMAQYTVQKLNDQIDQNRDFYAKILSDILNDMIREIILNVHKDFEDAQMQYLSSPAPSIEVDYVNSIIFELTFTIYGRNGEGTEGRHFMQLNVYNNYSNSYIRSKSAQSRRDYPFETCPIEIRNLIRLLNDNSKVDNILGKLKSNLQKALTYSNVTVSRVPTCLRIALHNLNV